MTLRLAKPISTITTSTGTRIEKGLSKNNYLTGRGCFSGIPGGDGKLAKLVTFGPNSASKFAHAGADQVIISYTPNDSKCQKAIEFFAKNRSLGFLRLHRNKVIDTNLTQDFLEKTGLSKKINV